MKAVKPLKTRAFIAKLLVLCMVLTLLPVSAFAAGEVKWEKDANNAYYYKISDDTTIGAVSLGTTPDSDVYYVYTDTTSDPKLTLNGTTINCTLYVGTKDGTTVSGQKAMKLNVDGVHLNGALSIWPNVTIENLSFDYTPANSIARMSLRPITQHGTVILEADSAGNVAKISTTSITVPANGTLEVKGKLEIPAGTTLTVGGTLKVDDGAEITIASGATLNLERTAQVTLSGDIIIDSGATYTNSNATVEGENNIIIVEEVDTTITGSGTVALDYTVEGDTNPTHLVLTESKIYSVAKDTEVTVTITPDSNHHLEDAYYTIGTDTKQQPLNSGDKIAVTDDLHISVTFAANSRPDNPPSYNPSTPSATVKTEAATNGSFTVSNQNAKAGDTVTVKPAPAAGYMVDAVTVTDKNGDSVAVKNNGDGTYSFVMPEASKQPVTVKVTFKPVPVFSDVKADDYFADAVDWAVSLGYVSGKGDGKFVPYAGCTRAEFITILYAVAGRPEPTLTTTDFEDVDYDAFYGKALLWATEKGVCSGVTATKFAPNAVISRAQAVMMLYKAADTPEVPAGATMKFTDVAENAYYYNAVLWASSVGAIAGVTDTTFAPNADCLRAQTVTILHSFKTAD